MSVHCRTPFYTEHLPAIRWHRHSTEQTKPLMYRIIITEAKPVNNAKAVRLKDEGFRPGEWKIKRR